MSLLTVLLLPISKYSEDQPRDAHGKWTSGGNDAASDAASRVSSRLHSEAEPDGRQQLDVSYEELTTAQGLNMSRFMNSSDTKLSEDESNALEDYTDYGYRKVNQDLRSENGKDCHICPELDSAISKGSLPKETEVFRGADLPLEVVSTLTPGAVLSDKGYVSASLSVRVGASFNRGRGGEPVVFSIKADKGSKALAVGNHGLYSEYEVLFPRNSQFQIDSVSKLRGEGVERTVVSMKYLGAAA